MIEALRDGRRRKEWLQGADPALAQALDAAFTGEKPSQIKTKGLDYAWLRFRWEGRTVESRITGKPTGGRLAGHTS